MRRFALVVLIVSSAWIGRGAAQLSSPPPAKQPLPAPSVALTFDDLPIAVVGNDHSPGTLKETREINAKLLRALKAHHAIALGLVNEAKLNVEGERDERVQVLEDWLADGMLLGNHGYNHVAFSSVSLQEYEEEFVRGDVITARLLQNHQIRERFFRPPYFDGGNTLEKKNGFAAFLDAHGYKIAPFTIQDEDWMFNAPYVLALRSNNAEALERVRSTYLAHLNDEVAHAEAESDASFHRFIPQILYIHANAITADTLDELLILLERRGYRFVSITDALMDPAYSTPDAFVGRAALSWLDRWQPALGQPIVPSEPKPPMWIRQDYQRITQPEVRRPDWTPQISR